MYSDEEIIENKKKITEEDINYVTSKLDTTRSKIRHFKECDSFNDNTLEGFISLSYDHRYGALVILYVNGEPARQVIYCTPKLRYPYNRLGEFIWPETENAEELFTP